MQIGTLIAGRYRLDDRLAAGGMGEVWRGTDTRLNRVVAVKLLHSGLSGNDRFRARFHQEAQAVAALQAPGIVQLYDYGEEHSPDGLVSYLIMELVRGRSLAEVLRERGRLAPSDTMKVIATAAEALETAHREHIIHRDIKPANLLVNEQGEVKIVDFGIASAKGQAGLTETGTVMGTLNYASPEQLQGTQLTGATDLYSLGIVAYECLAGRPPFPGNDPTAVITAHLTGQPAPLPNDVPPPIAQIVMRCLAKDPRQRYGSAGELARACREGRPGSGGTTAILPPAAMPPATSPMTQQMPQEDDRTALLDQGGYNDTPPGGPDLPPPRDFEEPKRSKAVPLLLTLAGVLVLVLVLAIWQPWNDDDRPEDDLADPTTAEATEDADDGEETAEDDGGEEQAEDTQQDTGGDDSDQGEETTTAAEEPTSAEIPPVTGELLADAVGQLNNAGFPNVGSEPHADAPAEGQECLVESQSPDSGEHDYSTPITLVFWDDGSGCGV